jgi:hypothetical protein
LASGHPHASVLSLALGERMVRWVVLSITALALLVGAPDVDAEKFGDWFAGTNGGTALYAASANDTGNIFGQFCFLSEGSCVWLIGVKTRCQEGDRYPVLANTNVGAMQLEVLCDGRLDSGLYRFAFTNFEQVEKLVTRSERVSFAMPVEEAQFGIVRFSLQGATAALSELREAAQRRIAPGARDPLEQRM